MRETRLKQTTEEWSCYGWNPQVVCNVKQDVHQMHASGPVLARSCKQHADKVAPRTTKQDFWW